jgi:uncharacterized membrane protein YhaH (DUF805 family)
MFKNSFSFEGRIRRTEYGLSILIAAAARVFISMIASEAGDGATALYYLLYTPVLWFFLAQGAKRCHDISISGWYQLIPLAPLYLTFASSFEDSNEYGVNPKSNTSNF